MAKKVYATVTELNDHAHQLAAERGINLILDASLPIDQGCAATATHPIHGTIRGVFARPVTDEASYSVVLHELGHHCSTRGQIREALGVMPPTNYREACRQRGLMLTEERSAWDWAEEHALIWTPTMAHVRMVCFSTYERLKEAA